MLWPLLGMSNQLLAACALIIGTTMLINMGKSKYSWITAIPGIFMVPVTMTAGYYLLKVNYALGNYLLVVITATVMTLMASIFILAFRKWFALRQTQPAAMEKLTPTV